MLSPAKSKRSTTNWCPVSTEREASVADIAFRAIPCDVCTLGSFTLARRRTHEGRKYPEIGPEAGARSLLSLPLRIAMLPPFIIEQLRRLEEQRQLERPQPRIELPEPEPLHPDSVPPDDRGVVTIQVWD